MKRILICLLLAGCTPKKAGLDPDLLVVARAHNALATRVIEIEKKLGITYPPKTSPQKGELVHKEDKK